MEMTGWLLSHKNFVAACSGKTAANMCPPPRKYTALPLHAPGALDTTVKFDITLKQLPNGNHHIDDETVCTS